MERLFQKECDPDLLSPLTLAFVGDCVFELFVRERLVCEANRPVQQLHRNSVAQVRCDAQARSIDLLMEHLTEKELSIYKRGRNAKATPPKNATAADYHKATGLEALFGYLYLKGDIPRLRMLYGKICEQEEL